MTGIWHLILNKQVKDKSKPYHEQIKSNVFKPFRFDCDGNLEKHDSNFNENRVDMEGIDLGNIVGNAIFDRMITGDMIEVRCILEE